MMVGVLTGSTIVKKGTRVSPQAAGENITPGEEQIPNCKNSFQGSICKIKEPDNRGCEFGTYFQECLTTDTNDATKCPYDKNTGVGTAWWCGQRPEVYGAKGNKNKLNDPHANVWYQIGGLGCLSICSPKSSPNYPIPSDRCKRPGTNDLYPDGHVLNPCAKMHCGEGNKYVDIEEVCQDGRAWFKPGRVSNESCVFERGNLKEKACPVPISTPTNIPAVPTNPIGGPKVIITGPDATYCTDPYSPPFWFEKACYFCTDLGVAPKKLDDTTACQPYPTPTEISSSTPTATTAPSGEISSPTPSPTVNVTQPNGLNAGMCDVKDKTDWFPSTPEPICYSCPEKDATPQIAANPNQTCDFPPYSWCTKDRVIKGIDKYTNGNCYWCSGENVAPPRNPVICSSFVTPIPSTTPVPSATPSLTITSTPSPVIPPSTWCDEDGKEDKYPDPTTGKCFHCNHKNEIPVEFPSGCNTWVPPGNVCESRGIQGKCVNTSITPPVCPQNPDDRDPNKFKYFDPSNSMGCGTNQICCQVQCANFVTGGECHASKNECPLGSVVADTNNLLCKDPTKPFCCGPNYNLDPVIEGELHVINNSNINAQKVKTTVCAQGITQETPGKCVVVSTLDLNKDGPVKPNTDNWGTYIVTNDGENKVLVKGQKYLVIFRILSPTDNELAKDIESLDPASSKRITIILENPPPIPSLTPIPSPTPISISGDVELIITERRNDILHGLLRAEACDYFEKKCITNDMILNPVGTSGPNIKIDGQGKTHRTEHYFTPTLPNDSTPYIFRLSVWEDQKATTLLYMKKIKGLTARSIQNFKGADAIQLPELSHVYKGDVTVKTNGISFTSVRIFKCSGNITSPTSCDPYQELNIGGQEIKGEENVVFPYMFDAADLSKIPFIAKVYFKDEELGSSDYLPFEPGRYRNNNINVVLTGVRKNLNFKIELDVGTHIPGTGYTQNLNVESVKYSVTSVRNTIEGKSIPIVDPFINDDKEKPESIYNKVGIDIAKDSNPITYAVTVSGRIMQKRFKTKDANNNKPDPPGTDIPCTLTAEQKDLGGDQDTIDLGKLLFKYSDCAAQNPSPTPESGVTRPDQREKILNFKVYFDPGLSFPGIQTQSYKITSIKGRVLSPKNNFEFPIPTPPVPYLNAATGWSRNFNIPIKITKDDYFPQAFIVVVEGKAYDGYDAPNNEPKPGAQQYNCGNDGYTSLGKDNLDQRDINFPDINIVWDTNLFVKKCPEYLAPSALPPTPTVRASLNDIKASTTFQNTMYDWEAGRISIHGVNDYFSNLLHTKSTNLNVCDPAKGECKN